MSEDGTNGGREGEFVPVKKIKAASVRIKRQRQSKQFSNKNGNFHKNGVQYSTDGDGEYQITRITKNAKTSTQLRVRQMSHYFVPIQ